MISILFLPATYCCYCYYYFYHWHYHYHYPTPPPPLVHAHSHTHAHKSGRRDTMFVNRLIQRQLLRNRGGLTRVHAASFCTTDVRIPPSRDAVQINQAPMAVSNEVINLTFMHFCLSLCSTRSTCHRDWSNYIPWTPISIYYNDAFTTCYFSFYLTGLERSCRSQN